jgi:hypothetical protein
VESGYKLRTVIKGVIQSPYFRAKGVQSNAISPEHAPFHESLGTAQFLTPELLDKKIEAVLGYPWTRGFDTRRLLLDLNEYQIYYGGIDSDGVTSRITAPNGLMSSVATRMAFEMACRTGARDFVLPAETRLLFPLVEPSYEPEDENGFNIPAGEAAIKANIVHLFKRILDEDLNAEDEEVIAAYDLWVGTWRAGKANVVAQTENRDVPGSCQVNNDYFTNEQLPEEQRFRSDPNYTVRAWNAVLAYLLSDARFLHN